MNKRAFDQAAPRKPRAAVFGRVSLLLVLGGACSDYFGAGPDPAADGRVKSCRPLTAIDAECPDMTACLETQCSQQLSACWSNFATVSIDAKSCESLVRCLGHDNTECSGCLTALAQCEQMHCGSVSCSVPGASGGSGGSGGTGGTGGTGTGGTSITSGSGSGGKGGNSGKGGTSVGGTAGGAGRSASGGTVASGGFSGRPTQASGGVAGNSSSSGGKSGAGNATGGTANQSNSGQGPGGGPGDVACSDAADCVGCASAALAASSSQQGAMVCCGKSHDLLVAFTACACDGACSDACGACSMPVPPGMNTCTNCLIVADPNGCSDEYRACAMDP